MKEEKQYVSEYNSVCKSDREQEEKKKNKQKQEERKMNKQKDKCITIQSEINTKYECWNDWISETFLFEVCVLSNGHYLRKLCRLFVFG